MALAARKHRYSITVDRQPKNRDDDKEMIRVHISKNSKRTQMAATLTNTTEKFLGSAQNVNVNFPRLPEEQNIVFSEY
jgi:hypothetical protein